VFNDLLNRSFSEVAKRIPNSVRTLVSEEELFSCCKKILQVEILPRYGECLVSNIKDINEEEIDSKNEMEKHPALFSLNNIFLWSFIATGQAYDFIGYHTIPESKVPEKGATFTVSEIKAIYHLLSNTEISQRTRKAVASILMEWIDEIPPSKNGIYECDYFNNGAVFLRLPKDESRGVYRIGWLLSPRSSAMLRPFLEYEDNTTKIKFEKKDELIQDIENIAVSLGICILEWRYRLQICVNVACDISRQKDWTEVKCDQRIKEICSKYDALKI
jgi:hypothetical protein